MAEDLYLVTERELQSATVNAAGELEFTRENGQKINAGPVRGPKGDKGDRGDKGLDGANVLPTSAAVAQAITEPGPARDQLSATIAQEMASSEVISEAAAAAVSEAATGAGFLTSANLATYTDAHGRTYLIFEPTPGADAESDIYADTY